jgi:Rad3-related DNA helicase
MYCPQVDDSWFIQIGKNDGAITNDVTRKVTSFIYKDELLQHFFRNPNSGLTLVSSSVNEGVDYKHDIARAQIILKRPTPSLGDPYVMSNYKGNPTFNIPRDPNFLDRSTYTDIMQMYGRIMRAEDDWGATIIYDQALAKAFTTLLSKRGSYRIRELGLDYLVSAIKGGIGDDGFPVFDWPFNK